MDLYEDTKGPEEILGGGNKRLFPSREQQRLFRERTLQSMGQVQGTGTFLKRSRGKHSARSQRLWKENTFARAGRHGIVFSASPHRWTESTPGVRDLSLRTHSVGWRFDYSLLLFLFCFINSFGNCTSQVQIYTRFPVF